MLWLKKNNQKFYYFSSGLFVRIISAYFKEKAAEIIKYLKRFSWGHLILNNNYIEGNEIFCGDFRTVLHFPKCYHIIIRNWNSYFLLKIIKIDVAHLISLRKNSCFTLQGHFYQNYKHNLEFLITTLSVLDEIVLRISFRNKVNSCDT